MAHIAKERFAHVGENAHDREAISRPSVTFLQDAMRRLVSNRVAMLCVVIVFIMLVFSIFAPILSPFEYQEQHYGHTDAPIGTVCDDAQSAGNGHVHLFGTDTLGRDIFTRIWMGGRVSLIIAFASAIVDFFLGAIYGGISGYFGGTLDIILMRARAERPEED